MKEFSCFKHQLEDTRRIVSNSTFHAGTGNIKNSVPTPNTRPMMRKVQRLWSKKNKDITTNKLKSVDIELEQLENLRDQFYLYQKTKHVKNI